MYDLPDVLWAVSSYVGSTGEEPDDPVVVRVG